MSDRDLHVHTQEGVCRLTLDRPQSRNGLTLELVTLLTTTLARIAEDSEVRVVVLAGAGGAFCSGLDLKDALGRVHDAEAGLRQFQALSRALYRLDKPTIAAIDGAAAGFGADLALACDLRLGSPRARLGARFVRIGLMPDGGGTFLLSRMVGRGRAFELLYSGRMVDADEALQLGILQEVLPQEDFDAAVHARAAKLAKGPPLAFARIKRAVRAANPGFEQALGQEAEGQLALLDSADFAEGVQAWFGKREPVFRGE